MRKKQRLLDEQRLSERMKKKTPKSVAESDFSNELDMEEDDSLIGINRDEVFECPIEDC